jgi:hypothetical protein
MNNIFLSHQISIRQSNFSETNRAMQAAKSPKGERHRIKSKPLILIRAPSLSLQSEAATRNPVAKINLVAGGEERNGWVQ